MADGPLRLVVKHEEQWDAECKASAIEVLEEALAHVREHGTRGVFVAWVNLDHSTSDRNSKTTSHSALTGVVTLGLSRLCQ
jgi:hypothetical protein